MIKRHSYALMIAFAAAGTLVSLWSLAAHYSRSASSGCNVSSVFNCEAVNGGAYSEIFGFPVAGIGVAGYATLLLVALAWRKQRDPLLINAFVAFAAAGLAFSLYLSYLEAFVIGAWCLLCLASFSAIVGAAASGRLAQKREYIDVIIPRTGGNPVL